MKTSPPRGGWSPRWGIRALVVASVVALVAAASAIGTTSRATVAPTNASLPTISGQAQTGSTLTANPGTWNGSAPITYQYQWLICGANGASCHDIAGATSNTYQLKADDAGNTARVRVIASNSDGSASATSNPTGNIAVGQAKPTNSSLPSISGTPTVGQTLTANPGTWNGPTPITYAYQWLICNGSGNACHDISGATGTTYQVRSSDPGNTVRVSVTATNAGGSTSAQSEATAKIAASGGSGGGSGSCAGVNANTTVSVNDIAPPIRLQVDRFTGDPSLIGSGFTRLTMRFHVSDTCGRTVTGASVYATAVPYQQVNVPPEAVTDSSGWATMTFQRLRGFPATPRQQLFVMFVRARKLGDPVLAGISTRRLISLRVNLNR